MRSAINVARELAGHVPDDNELKSSLEVWADDAPPPNNQRENNELLLELGAILKNGMPDCTPVDWEDRLHGWELKVARLWMEVGGLQAAEV